MLTYELEIALENEGYHAVCGVDEAGKARFEAALLFADLS